MHNFTLTKISIEMFTTKKVIQRFQRNKESRTVPNLVSKSVIRGWLAECHHLRQGMRSPGGH